MLSLDNHIEPGEKVIWRTGSLRGEAITSVAWIAGLAAFAAAAAIWLDEGFPYLIGAFVAVILFAQWGRQPAEVWITDRRILFLRAVLLPRISMVERSDVTHVELYDSDDTLVLHGSDGELFRAAVLEKPDNLLEELGLPVAFWRDRVQSHLFNFNFLAFFFVLLSIVLVIIVAAIGLIFLAGKDGIRAVLSDLSSLTSSWHEVIAILAMASTIPLGTIIGLAGAALVRQIMLTPDEMTGFRRAVRYPVWGGYDPQSPLYKSWIYRLYRTARLVLDRLLYGRPPDGGSIEPDIVAPGDLNEYRD